MTPQDSNKVFDITDKDTDAAKKNSQRKNFLISYDPRHRHLLAAGMISVMFAFIGIVIALNSASKIDKGLVMSVNKINQTVVDRSFEAEFKQFELNKGSEIAKSNFQKTLLKEYGRMLEFRDELALLTSSIIEEGGKVDSQAVQGLTEMSNYLVTAGSNLNQDTLKDSSITRVANDLISSFSTGLEVLRLIEPELPS